MRFPASRGLWAVLATAAVLMALNRAYAQESKKGAPNPYLKGSEGYYKGPRGLTSYQPVAIDQPFAATMAHEVAAKPGIEREHQPLPEERYDLGDHPAQGVTMEHGKPLQERCARQAAIGGDSSTCIDLESTCIDLESTTCPIAVNF